MQEQQASGFKFDEDLIVNIYIQLAVLSNTIDSLLALLYYNGTLSTEEVNAISEDAKKVVDKIAKGG